MRLKSLFIAAVIIICIAINLNPAICKAQTLKFGLTADLSSLNSIVGRSIQLGLESAFNEANASSKRFTFALAHLDDRYDPFQMRTNVEKLAENHEILAVISAAGGINAIAVAPRARMLFFAAIDGSTVLSPHQKERYIATYKADYKSALEQLATAIQNGGLTSEEVAVLYQDDDYGTQGFQYLQDAFKKTDPSSDLTGSSYPRNTAFVTNAFDSIAGHGKKIKVFVIIGNSKPATKFIKIAKESFPESYFFLLSATDNLALSRELCSANLKLCQEFSRNVVFATTLNPFRTDSKFFRNYRSAIAEYLEKQGDRRRVHLENSLSAMEGYLIGRTLVEAAYKVPEGTFVEREELIDALAKVDTIDDREIKIGHGPADTIQQSQTATQVNFWMASLVNQHLRPFDWKKIEGRKSIKRNWAVIQSY